MRSGRRQAHSRRGGQAESFDDGGLVGTFPSEEVSSKGARQGPRSTASRGIAGCVISIARTRRKPAPYTSKALIILPMPSKNHSQFSPSVHILHFDPYNGCPYPSHLSVIHKLAAHYAHCTWF